MSPEPYYQKPAEQEGPEEPTIRVGQKILYDVRKGQFCYFVVTEVDEEESEVNGYFFVEVPTGAEVLNAHYDSEEYDVYVTFKTSDKGITELKFNVYTDPDELDAYNIYVDGVTAEPASVI